MAAAAADSDRLPVVDLGAVAVVDSAVVMVDSDMVSVVVKPRMMDGARAKAGLQVESAAEQDKEGKDQS